MASSGEILRAREKTQVSDRDSDQGTTQVLKELFFLGLSSYAEAVAQLLVSSGPAPALPGRLCIVGAVEVAFGSALRKSMVDQARPARQKNSCRSKKNAEPLGARKKPLRATFADKNTHMDTTQVRLFASMVTPSFVQSCSFSRSLKVTIHLRAPFRIMWL